MTWVANPLLLSDALLLLKKFANVNDVRSGLKNGLFKRLEILVTFPVCVKDFMKEYHNQRGELIF